MGDVVSHKDGDLWSVSRLASAFDMDRRTVSKRLEGVGSAGERNRHPVYHIKVASKAIWQVGRAGGGSPLDLDQFPEARKCWYQSENERLKFEQTIGQLIYASDAHRAMATMVKAMAAGLDSLPDLLEREADLPSEGTAIVISLVDGMRETMAENVSQAILDEFKQVPDPEI